MEDSELSGDRQRALLSGLEPRHRRALQLLARGFRVVDVAGLVGYRPETITRLKTRHASLLDELAALQEVRDLATSDEEFRARLRQLRNEHAGDVHRELLYCDNANARARALIALYDRTGLGASQEIEYSDRDFKEYFFSPRVQALLSGSRAGEIALVDAGPLADTTTGEGRVSSTDEQAGA